MGCCDVAAGCSRWQCCLLSCLRVPPCFTRMARASSAIEPLARVRVLHGHSKVTISMLGAHDKPARSARHNSLHRNHCMTVQALLRTPTAHHEHQCKAKCFATCRLFSLRSVVLTFAALCTQLCTPAHSQELPTILLGHALDASASVLADEPSSSSSRISCDIKVTIARDRPCVGSSQPNILAKFVAKSFFFLA